MSRLVGPVLGLIFLGIVAVVGSGILIVMLASASTSKNVSTQTLTVATPAADTPTPVPTFTPMTTPTEKPTVVNTATATPTAAATDTPLPAPTSTAVPPTSTARPRPTNTPPPPTEVPKPSVDFKVVEQRLFGKNENGGCFGRHAYFISVIDKAGAPLNGIQVRRVNYEGPHPIPFTGEKGPGKTEEVTPRYGGDQLYIDSDNSGQKYSSERTRNLSVSEIDIPIPDLIATGYCPNDAAACAQMIRDNILCLGHHSYNIIFQRQW